MIRMFVRLSRDNRASSAAEFALVLPLLIIFLLGIIDVGRLMWTWNQVEKATQMGVRYAVATDMVPSGLSTFNFVSGSITQGDPIPSTSFAGETCGLDQGTLKCGCPSGNLSGAACSWGNTADTTAFTNIVDRMNQFMPQITANSVQIDYDYSGLGYAGDPNGPDVSPLVRVSIRPGTMTFRPLLLSLFNGTIPLPSFSAALTMEDGQGTVSN